MDQQQSSLSSQEWPSLSPSPNVESGKLVSMTLKIHVILDHYMWYFGEMGTHFYNTNGEYVEAVHYSLDGHEDKRKFKVSRNIGTDQHLKKALSSHISYNSLRVGSPDRIMSIRKKNPNSPLAL